MHACTCIISLLFVLPSTVLRTKTLLKWPILISLIILLSYSCREARNISQGGTGGSIWQWHGCSSWCFKYRWLEYKRYFSANGRWRFGCGRWGVHKSGSFWSASGIILTKKASCGNVWTIKCNVWMEWLEILFLLQLEQSFVLRKPFLFCEAHYQYQPNCQRNLY